jgi:hypothetical protein
VSSTAAGKTSTAEGAEFVEKGLKNKNLTTPQQRKRKQSPFRCRTSNFSAIFASSAVPVFVEDGYLVWGV